MRSQPLFRVLILVAVATLWGGTGSFGATPATVPATRPAVVATPAGFVRYEIGDRSFISIPADQGWIAEAAERAKPGVAGTQPADMIERLAVHREKLETTMLADLPTLTPSQLDQFLDSDLIPLLKRLSTLSAKPVYLVAAGEHIKEAVRAGWSDPRLYYNKAADTFEVGRSVTFDEPARVDESLVIVLFRPDDNQEARTANLSEYLTAAETDVKRAMTGRSNALVLGDLANFIADKGMSDLPRSEDQIWLTDGLSTVMAAKYLSLFHGATQIDFIRQLAMDPRGTPVPATTIDLLHPLPSDQLLPQLVVPYAAARHRKGVAVMYIWETRAGEKQIQPVISAVARLRPADGATLAATIKTVSGIDLSADLARQ